MVCSALHDAAESGDENLVEGILANAVRDVEFVPEVSHLPSETTKLLRRKCTATS